ncbi:MAG: hypothetical protein ABL907_18410 [Hyphomicrobium sp.]
MGNEFWAAVIGSIIGGAIAGIIQYFTLRHQTSEQDKIRRQKHKALGRSLTFKLMRLTSDLHAINTHLAESQKLSTSEMKNDPWSYVLPIANLPDRIKFLENEIALVMEGNNALATDLLDIEATHASSLQLLQKYADIRQLLTEKMPPSQLDGNTGSTDLNAEQLAALRPRMIELNSIISALISRSQADLDLAKATTVTVNKILSEKHNLRLKLEFKE